MNVFVGIIGLSDAGQIIEVYYTSILFASLNVIFLLTGRIVHGCVHGCVPCFVYKCDSAAMFENYLRILNVMFNLRHLSGLCAVNHLMQGRGFALANETANPL